MLGVGQLQNAPLTPAGFSAPNSVRQTPTLVSAMSSVEDLNKRLIGMRSSLMEIAQAIGGPFPTPASSDRPNAPHESAMEKLNDNVTEAHATVTELENAIGAIRRALGG